MTPLLRHPTLRRFAIAAFLAVVAWLLIGHARSIDWEKVLASLRRFDSSTLWLAALPAAASYGVYACVDLFARAYTGRDLPRWLTMAIAVVSYAFNQNLGPLVGSVGFRYRLYARFGVAPALIGRIVALSLVTNWSGYLLVAGIAFSGRFVRLPAGYEIGTAGLQICGVALLAVIAAYVAACAYSRRRSFRIRSIDISLPSGRIALAQVLLSSVNWCLIPAVIYVLLHAQADYPSVLAVFLLSSIAGAATHIPAGLGVTEAVFVSLLGGSVPRHELLAALLAYRGIYYLAPLALAFVLYLWLEARPRVELPDDVTRGAAV